MIVMKFGGSSVADREQVHKVMDIVSSRQEEAPMVVSSAHKGMTDALVNAAKAAVRRDFQIPDVIDMQSEIADSMGCSPDILSGFYTEISDLLRGIGLVGELSPRSLDYISSFGERMAVRVIADYFSRNGLPAKAFDVWDLGFITDANFGNARPLSGAEAEIKKAYAELCNDGVVPIVTGFVGKTPNNEITTVGRNGSDYTAAILAAALDAGELQIWTDTDGVMTADPSVVSEAKNIPAMSFDEAAELAFFGSRVLHPSCILPASGKGIAVRVMNTNRPQHPGTVIGGYDGENSTHEVKSIAYKENQAVLTITSTQMLQQSGFLSQVFGAVAELGVVVDMISTSEISVSFSTGQLDRLDQCVQSLSRFGDCRVATGKTMLVVVGKNLAQRKGQGADILTSMKQAGVRIEMLSFGLDSINFSMVVDDRDIDLAVQELHRVLFGA